MITLEPIDERNFRQLIEMQLPPEQARFVAPNVRSLAEAWLYYDAARPYAVCRDGEPVGFLMLHWDEQERIADVWRLMVAPAYQRQGCGRAALTAAIRLARESGAIDAMLLSYVPGNEGGQALYASLGFRETGIVSDGEIVMRLPLTDAPRVGTHAADMDDLDRFTALIGAEALAGRPVPAALADAAALKQAIADGRVTRISVAGETVGLALGDALLLADGSREYLSEARQTLYGWD